MGMECTRITRNKLKMDLNDAGMIRYVNGHSGVILFDSVPFLCLVNMPLPGVSFAAESHKSLLTIKDKLDIK